MAIRFRRTGTTNLSDHNELLNRGIRTHAEIDVYLDEIDAARRNNVDLDQRLSIIEEKNTKQDERLDGVDEKDEEQDKRLSDIENVNEEQDTAISTINTNLVSYGLRLNSVEADILEYHEKFTELEDELGDIETDLGGVEQNISDLQDSITDVIGCVKELEDLSIEDYINELVIARTDKFGVTFDSLKERLDAQQGTGSSGGSGGGSIVVSGYLFQVYNPSEDGEQIITVESEYTLGKNEIEVFRGGARQIKDIHYHEIDSKTILIVEPMLVGEVFIVRRRDRHGTVTPLHLTEKYEIANGTEAIFSVSEPFNTPDKKLEVYYNGILLDQHSEYITNENNQVAFNFTPVKGSLIVFQVVDKNKLQKEYLSEENQDIEVGKKVYTLNQFTVKDSELEVYVQGVRWQRGTDYQLVDNRTVKFTTTLPPNGKISFLKEIGLNLINNNSFEILSNRVRELEEGPFVSIKQVEMLGINATNNDPFIKEIEINNASDYRTLPIHVLLYKQGAWKGAIHGIDFDYDYPNDISLRVYLYKNGDYKINY